MGLDIKINDGELRTAVSSLLRIDAALSEMPRLTDDTANAVGDATLARAVKEFTDSWRVKREDIITMVRAHRTALEAILKWSDAVDSIGGRSPGGVLGEAVSRSVEETRRRIEQNLGGSGQESSGGSGQESSGGSGQEDLDGIEQIPVTPLERPSRVPPMVPPLHDLGSFHTLPAPVTRPTASSASGQGPALVTPDVDAALLAVGTAPTARPAQVGTGAPVASLEDVDAAAPATVNTIGQTTAAASLDGTTTTGAVPVSTISGAAPPAALDGTTTAEPATVSTIDGGGATARLETTSGAEGAPVTAVSGATATASLDETPTAEPATVSTISGAAPPAALDGTTTAEPAIVGSVAEAPAPGGETLEQTPSSDDGAQPAWLHRIVPEAASVDLDPMASDADVVRVAALQRGGSIASLARIAADSAPAVAQIDVEAAVPQPRLNTFEEQTRALRESLGLPIKEER